jgi:tRNA G26 N,N-dimethylase Trm1
MIRQTYSTAMISKMVEVFKTDVQDVGQSVKLICKLKEHIPGSCINFDLEDCDNVLRVEAENFTPESVIMLLKKYGYQCEVLV